MADTQVLFAQVAHGDIQKSNFKVEKVDTPTLAPDSILVRVLYLTVDPYMRPKMELTKSYTQRYEVGKPLYGDGIGRVIDSKNGNFKEGDLVFSPMLSWKEVEVYSSQELKDRRITVLDTLGLPTEEALHVVGMTGVTAWIGMCHITKLKSGSNVLISGASGAVGSIAGQIAKLKGCKVWGLCGTQEKCDVMRKEFGFDGGINYKSENLSQLLEKEFPKGIDLYWDNVGGSILDAVFPNMAQCGKIVACGAISGYNTPVPINNYFFITVRRLTMEGFIVFDHLDMWDKARKDLAMWYKQGKIKTQKCVLKGIESLPEALMSLFEKGSKFSGKVIVKVCDEGTAGAAQ